MDNPNCKDMPYVILVTLFTMAVSLMAYCWDKPGRLAGFTMVVASLLAITDGVLIKFWPVIEQAMHSAR